MFAFGIIGLAVGIVGIVAHYYSAGSVYTLALAAFSPYLSIAAVGAALVFAFIRTPAGWVGCAVSAAVVSWFVIVHVPGYIASSAPTNGHDVVVMTSNLRVGSADPASVVAAVRTHGADVVMLEELTPEIRESLDHAGLDRLLPYSVTDPRDGGSGTGLWSRYRLSATTTSEDFGFAYITANADVDGSEVSLAAVHVYGPYPQPQFRRWQYDMASYPAALGKLPSPTALIGGDFNATPDTAQFRGILDHGFSDAANQAGAGFTPTWPSDRWYPPLITIDHVLTRGAVATSVDSIEIPGSDHRALVATVRIPAR